MTYGRHVGSKLTSSLMPDSELNVRSGFAAKIFLHSSRSQKYWFRALDAYIYKIITRSQLNSFTYYADQWRQTASVSSLVAAALKLNRREQSAYLSVIIPRLRNMRLKRLYFLGTSGGYYYCLETRADLSCSSGFRCLLKGILDFTWPYRIY